MNKLALLAASILLALTLSCSSDDGNETEGTSSSSSEMLVSSSSGQSSSSSHQNNISSSSEQQESSSSSEYNGESSSSKQQGNSSSSSPVEYASNVMFWGHEPFDNLEALSNDMQWYIDQGYVEMKAVASSETVIQFSANTGYRVIIIPQSIGVPAGIYDAGGINVKNSLFNMSNFEINGIPYYLFVSDVSGTDSGNVAVTIRW
jgi:hypothetical protein